MTFEGGPKIEVTEPLSLMKKLDNVFTEKADEWGELAMKKSIIIAIFTRLQNSNENIDEALGHLKHHGPDAFLRRYSLDGQQEAPTSPRTLFRKPSVSSMPAVKIDQATDPFAPVNPVVVGAEPPEETSATRERVSQIIRLAQDSAASAKDSFAAARDALARGGEENGNTDKESGK